jgi:hypothetical protein
MKRLITQARRDANNLRNNLEQMVEQVMAIVSDSLHFWNYIPQPSRRPGIAFEGLRD